MKISKIPKNAIRGSLEECAKQLVAYERQLILERQNRNSSLKITQWFIPKEHHEDWVTWMYNKIGRELNKAAKNPKYRASIMLDRRKRIKLFQVESDTVETLTKGK